MTTSRLPKRVPTYRRVRVCGGALIAANLIALVASVAFGIPNSTVIAAVLHFVLAGIVFGVPNTTMMNHSDT